jgi:hypothetical protein
MEFERIERGLEGMRLGNSEVGLVNCKIWSKFDYFHWNLIKKMERKIQWDVGSQGLFGKALSEVVHICLKNWFFLSLKP